MKGKSKHLWALSLAVLMAGTALPLPAIFSRDNSTPTASASSEATFTRREENFNSDWKFALNLEDDSTASAREIVYDESWKSVNLPHDFSITQDFTEEGEAESGYLLGGTGWYRKSFKLSEEAEGQETVVLNFDGAYKDTYVYVNGEYIGENHYGYNNFAFDITNKLVYDGQTNNVIAVKVDHQTPSSRWYSGSGIYRDVTLIRTNKIHFSQNSTIVTTPDISLGSGKVDVQVTLQNDTASEKEAMVLVSVIDGTGKNVSNIASKTVTLGKNSSVTENLSTIVDNPTLWSIENPYRYTLRTEIIYNGQIVDSQDTMFGFRYFSFNVGTGFSLNGENVKLNGVCMHHDQGALGAVANYDAIYRQMTIMKNMGVNAIRVTHNPASKHLIDICEEMGLLVIEELFDGWTVPKNSNVNDFAKYFKATIGTTSTNNNILGGDNDLTWAEFVVNNVVSRDRNSPAIIMWSIGNEVGYNNESFVQTARNLVEWVANNDPTRPTTIGDNSRSTSDTISSRVAKAIQEGGGIVGFNYAKGTGFDLLNDYYGGVINGSETASAISSRGIYNTITTTGYYKTSYDNQAVEWGQSAHNAMWDIITRDFVAGSFVWTGFDYIGEPTPWNGTASAGRPSNAATWPAPNSSYFGIVDTAGFEKDTYYLYRSQWKQDDTTLHLVTAWDSENQVLDNSKTPVWVYSNAPKVKLFLNGSTEPIATATRTVNTTSVGHKYFTYSNVSHDTSICTAVDGNGSTNLYSVFNIQYTEGNITAVAYDEDDNVIENTVGKSSVSTPDRTNLKLSVYSNKSKILANETSLAYITIDITDDKGNLDTTASNTLNISLSGEGKIVGVDNGNQATNEKFQQSSVLISEKSATIKTFAGKALVIVQSNGFAGDINLQVTSDGIESQSLKVESVTELENIVKVSSYSYTNNFVMVKGETPLLDSSAKVILSDGSLVDGYVTWTYPTEGFDSEGQFTINGIIEAPGLEKINVTATLTILDAPFAFKNTAMVTEQGIMPSLPTTVKGIGADGNEAANDYPVTWESTNSTAFDKIGAVVRIKGVAIYNGVSLPVYCNVRVIESLDDKSNNVDSSVTLAQDIDESKQSDTLDSIKDGNVWSPILDTTSQNVSSQEKLERWTNYSNRSVSKTSTITFTFTEKKTFNYADIYYYLDNTCKLPSNVEFSYSTDDSNYTIVNHQELMKESHAYINDSSKTGKHVFYKFVDENGDLESFDATSIKITLTQQAQENYSKVYCVGITEVQIGQLNRLSPELETLANLSDIKVDGETVNGFSPDTVEYQASGRYLTASAYGNTAITTLPAQHKTYKIVTSAEDGSSKIYTVTVDGTELCKHLHTEIINAKEPTCTEKGNTGDVSCSDCNKIIKEGYEIPALGHNWNESEKIEPTLYEEGKIVYRCSRCGETKTEILPHLVVAPTVTLSITEGSETNVTFKGQFVDYSHVESYYSVSAKGFILIAEQNLTTGEKTVQDTLTYGLSGVTRINVAIFSVEGEFKTVYTPFNPAQKYYIRAYIAYKNTETNNVEYGYSDVQLISALELANH